MAYVIGGVAIGALSAALYYAIVDDRIALTPAGAIVAGFLVLAAGVLIAAGRAERRAARNRYNRQP